MLLQSNICVGIDCDIQVKNQGEKNRIVRLVAGIGLIVLFTKYKH